MDLSSLLTPQRVRCGLEVHSKKRALEQLSELLVDTDTADAERAVFEGLTLRERLGSTGLGRGVALPHSRSRDIDQPQAALIRLAQPIGFDAVDREPVDLLFALLVPEHSNDEHLRILSELAEMFRDEALCARLRHCSGDDDLFAAVCGWQATPPAT
ncbi:MAG: PTS sugar transporter subunit IIA [Spiribacter sp.]|jgi:PTS system nitrogen regulatory IIA component|nr:PTS sugar transporter subunit IIA [Spiribacter sp.]MDR9489498.1 PTS sugar transporter subunit IIA [Spiribacter sp.]